MFAPQSVVLGQLIRQSRNVRQQMTNHYVLPPFTCEPRYELPQPVIQAERPLVEQRHQRRDGNRLGDRSQQEHRVLAGSLAKQSAKHIQWLAQQTFSFHIQNNLRGSIDKGDINERLSLKTTKTELLFVNRVYNSLVNGGIAGVIVPDGVLFGSSTAHKQLRKILIEDCELQGVISMPSGVFKPYAGVSTAIIIFVKGGKTERVWFYDMESDGYSLDDKRDKLESSDIPDIIDHWKNREKEDNTDKKQKHFFVPVNEIIENGYDLSINRYKEIKYEEVKYEKPVFILKKIEDIEEEIKKGIKMLKELVK